MDAVCTQNSWLKPIFQTHWQHINLTIIQTIKQKFNQH